MAEYVVKGAEPNETVLHGRTPNGYESWQWLPVRERIVRCRDCKHYREHVNGCVEFGDESRGEYAIVEPDGFCKWGVRRDGE